MESTNKETWDDFDDYVDLIWSVVRQYNRSFRHYDYEDLFNEGVIVYIKCKRSFEPGRGFEFSTYLVNCIEKHYRSLLYYKDKGYKTTKWRRENIPKESHKLNLPIKKVEYEDSDNIHSNSIINVKIIQFNSDILKELEPYINGHERRLGNKIRNKLMKKFKKCLIS